MKKTRLQKNHVSVPFKDVESLTTCVFQKIWRQIHGTDTVSYTGKMVGLDIQNCTSKGPGLQCT